MILPSANEVLGKTCDVFSLVCLSFCPQSGSHVSRHGPIQTCSPGHPSQPRCTMLKYPVHSLAPLTLYSLASRKFQLGANLHFTPALSLDLFKFFQLETPQTFSNFKLLSPALTPLPTWGTPGPVSPLDLFKLVR